MRRERLIVALVLGVLVVAGVTLLVIAAEVSHKGNVVGLIAGGMACLFGAIWLLVNSDR